MRTITGKIVSSDITDPIFSSESAELSYSGAFTPGRERNANIGGPTFPYPSPYEIVFNSANLGEHYNGADSHPRNVSVRYLIRAIP
jgi:hypothetical protein